MNRLIIAVAIFIPLATVMFVTMNKRGKESSEPDRQVAEQDVDKETEVKEQFTVEITGDNFDQMVKQSELPVVLDFWASWCGPCMMLGPHIDEIAQEYVGVAVVGKVNVDEHKELAVLYEAQSIPLVLVLKGGEVITRIEAFRPQTPDEIREAIDSLIEP